MPRRTRSAYNEAMASGKASKRKRAAQRAQAAARARTSPARDRRLWVAAAVVALLAVSIAVGVAVALSGGNDEVPAASSEPGTTLPDAGEAIAVFRGLPQEGLALGNADAPVTMLEFVDLQCPFCRDFEVETLPSLVREHVRSGELRIELRGLAFLGPDSERGLRAVLAAAQQDRAFQLMELLYFSQGAENSGWLSQELVEAAARSVPGVDVPRLAADMNSAAVSDLIAEHAAEAERRGVDSTPSLLVGPTGGELRKVDAAPTDVAAIERAITAARPE